MSYATTGGGRRVSCVGYFYFFQGMSIPRQMAYLGIRKTCYGNCAVNLSTFSPLWELELVMKIYWRILERSQERC